MIKFALVSDAPKGTKLPARKTRCSMGYDFFLPCDVELKPGESTGIIPLNIKAYMPDDIGLELHIRSSVGLLKHVKLANGVGLIDADYVDNPDNEGNIGIVLENWGAQDVSFKKGDRICQGVFRKYYTVDDDAANGERTGGTGSTGV